MATIVVVVCATILIPSRTLGHEFWIDPVAFSVPEGAEIQADLRVGQEFEGSAYSFNPNTFRRFDLASGDAVGPVESRLGDRPALNQPAAEGLAVVVHETTDNRLKYTEFEKFVAFVTHKDAVWTVDQHRARGLSETDFVEAYSRYAKALVAVGDGAGQDQAYGMLTEFVALANPYTDDLEAGFPVELIYDGKPRADAQVEVFEKAPDGGVEITLTRTDEAGRVTIPVKPGYRYMLDAVVLREPSADLSDSMEAVWESLWANLTFEVPTR